jgi:hypothetical protein
MIALPRLLARGYFGPCDALPSVRLTNSTAWSRSSLIAISFSGYDQQRPRAARPFRNSSATWSRRLRPTDWSMRCSTTKRTSVTNVKHTLTFDVTGFAQPLARN